MSDEVIKQEELKTVNPFEGLQGDAVWEEAKKYPNIMSVLDNRISTGINSFKENKLPGIVETAAKEREDKVRAEVNPKETPEQKKIRELEARLESSDNEKALAKLQDELSLKAKELEFDTIDARDFAIYGENAIEKLEKYAAKENARVEERLSTEIKNKYSKVTPKSNTPPADIETRIKEARASGNGDLALRLQMLKQTQTA